MSPIVKNSVTLCDADKLFQIANSFQAAEWLAKASSEVRAYIAMRVEEDLRQWQHGGPEALLPPKSRRRWGRDEKRGAA